MRCPKCNGYQVRIVDSRPYDDQVRRRRECTTCGVRFNTIEIHLTDYKLFKDRSTELKLRYGK